MTARFLALRARNDRAAARDPGAWGFLGLRPRNDKVNKLRTLHRRGGNYFKHFLRAGYLSLFFSLLFSAPLFAEIRQWDFDNPEDYQYDPQKIELKDGAAKLAAVAPYQDAGAQSFQRGQFSLNTSAERGTLELALRGLQETPGPELPSPVGNREPGLAALWHADEPSGTNLLDAIGRTVAKASDAEVVSGQTGFGYARKFDGEKSFVFIPHYETLVLRGPFSLEAWVRPAAVRNSKPQTLISRWQTVGAQRGFALQISPDGKIDFLVSPDGATVVRQTGSTVLADGSWVHVAAVYTGQDLRIYLNGVLDGMPQPFAGPVYSADNPIYLGALVDNRVDQFYKGVIDEAAIYQRALNETETLAHFGNLQGIVGLWHFNERSGVLADASGYGHNGSVFGDVHYESEGKMGTGLAFHGKGAYVQMPATSRLAPHGQMSLEAWVKPENLPGLGQHAAVLSIYEDSDAELIPSEARDSAGSEFSGLRPRNDGKMFTHGGEFSLSLVGPEGRVAAYASGLQPPEARGRISLMPGVWQHVAVSWSQGEVRIYNNGILDTVSSYSGSLDLKSAALRLGSDAKNLAPFQGAIDEPAVYRRPRTGKEIAQAAGLFAPGGIYRSDVKDAHGLSPWRSMSWKLPLPYAQENDGHETGLLSLYHLNDAEGASLADSKGEIHACEDGANHAPQACGNYGIPASPIGTYPVPGVFGKARWFAAKGYDKILSQKDFPALSTFSLSLWFEFASGQAGLNDRLFSIGDGNPTAFRGPDGHLHVQMQGAREIIGERLLGDTAWHHLALTADGRSLFLYIDGLLDGNSPFMTATSQSPLVLGNLKSTDTFQGAIDEFLFYNYPLDRDTILQQYMRGQMDVKMLVRSSEEPSFANAPWRGPQGVRWAEEPGVFTTGLWHFEEGIFKGEAGEIQDASHFANHGTVFGKILRFPAAVIGNGVEFNGSTDFIRIPDSDSMHMDRFSLSAWVRPSGMAEGQSTLFDKQFKAGAPVFSSFALELLGGNRLALRIGRPGGYRQIESGRDGEIAAGRWSHVAAVYDKKQVRLYINGKLVKAADLQESIPYDDGPLYFGRYGSSEARYFRGAMDEVHFQNTAASDEEVLAKFLQQDPQNFFRPFETQNPGVAPARYFQYEIFLNTNLPFASPAVSEVHLRANSFSTDRPSISPKNGISYAEITHFVEKTGKHHGGAVSYQISPDGANWFFHNGRHWVVAASAQESNTAGQIQTHVHDFAKEAGIGSFYFRAFLQSPSGAEPAELDSVEVEYLPNQLTVIAPNGGEAFLAGSEQAVRWNSTGDIPKVNVEYSKDGFKNDFHEIAKGAANTGNFSWKVPDDLSPHIKVRVMSSLDPRIYDTSDIPFRIAGKLEVVSPNWNERWEVGSAQKIVWKTQGTIPEVKIEYSTDDFEKSIYPVVDSVKNEGGYSWKVPDHISGNVKVRISDGRDPQVSDKSNDTFAITGKLAILAPAIGARWLVGSEQEIRWQSTGTISLVHLEYQTSKKQEWVRIAENFESRGSYSWKVPDDIDAQTKIRVLDAGDEKVFAESEPFAIVGGLRLLNPKGGEQWTAGTRRKIAWQSVGSIPTVDVEYKTSPDGKWQKIEKALANVGSYVWEVPASITGPVLVRVVDSHDPFVEAVHASASSVIPGFHMKYPNGGEEWKVGTEQSILWETVGEAEKVKLEYSKDGFKNDIHEIIRAASNLGSYTWTVPDDAALTAQIRVLDASNPAAQAASNAPFRIFGAFNIEIPKGGEKFEVGSRATLVWKTLGTIPNVKIEYSHDDFRKDARLIEASVPNEGKYAWPVPDDIGNGYQIRISDVRDPKTEVYSENHFSVIGNFHLLYPVGGEDLIAGTVLRIAWKGAGSVPVVRIDYSEDNFEKSFNTITGNAPNSGSFEWVVPNLIGRKFKVRIWDPSQPDSMDTMNLPARIVGGFRLLEPNGGEVLYVGDRVEIKWETSGTLPRIKIEFSPDNFTKEISAIADSYPNNGRYEWLVPNAPAGNYRVRISDPRDVTAFDISNADFRIRSRFLLQAPNGSEGWPVGEKRTIRWQTSAAVSQVRLEYATQSSEIASSPAAPRNDGTATSVIASTGADAPAPQSSAKESAVIASFARPEGAKQSQAGWILIADRAPNTGVYEWTIPDDVSQNAFVRVSDVQDPEARDISDKPFRIQGVITLTRPNGGEVWKVGEQRAITWNTVGHVEGVRLEYSRDGFASESKVIAESTPNAGHFNWTVPDDISALAKIRVMDVKDPEVQDMSDAPFQMAGAFMVLAPNGGESWHAAEKREITWMTVGSVKDISLDYSADDFKTWSAIERGIMNTGRYVWDIPSMLGENYKVRICDADNPKACDFSDNVFAVRSPIEITAPRGGERWTVSGDQEIRWNTYGMVRRVSVSYSPKAGEWKNLIEELPNEGHFLFKAPDDISKNIFFKVTDYDDETLFGVTPGPLTLMGSFDLIRPSGGEKWAAGTRQKMTWDTLGTVSNARLEYSVDDFKNDINLIESSYTNTGSYDWTLPAKTGLTMKVRVSDAENPEAFGISKDVFKILPGLTLIHPNGGEQWTAGHKQKVVWKTAGKSDWVRLEYAEMSSPHALGGDSSVWVLIADRVPNGGEYEWELPKQNGREFLLRVSDSLDPDASDISDNFFEIKPELLLNHPAGGESLLVGSPAEILWDTVGSVPFVKIDYSTDGFQKDIRTVADKMPNQGKFLWTVPDHITAGARVRVSNTDDPVVQAVSPKPFKILPTFEVLAPTALDSWTVGSEQVIQWNWRGSVDTVKLEYSINDFAASSAMIPAAPNKGSFRWRVPDLAHSQVRVRVSSPVYPEANAVSQTFKIIPGFKMLAPNGGEKWRAGERQNIEWQTAGTGSKVKLEYGVMNQEVTVWKTIESVVRNAGRYEWRVPEDLSSKVKVRVSDVLEAAASDESDQPFKILGVFKVLAPHPDESLHVEDRFQVRWETRGKVPSVKLEYSANPGQPDSFAAIENLWANSGSYFWTVPDAANEKIWLKISDATEPDAFQISDAPFKIRGTLVWDLPAEAPAFGGLNWPVSNVQTLKWKTVGTIPKVNLEYTTDQKNWKTIASGISNGGSYGWTVPDDTAPGVKLRVSDAERPLISDVTEQPITISAQFKISAPRAGETWTVGSSHKIQWETTGHVQKIWLESMTDGKKWQPLAGPLPAGLQQDRHAREVLKTSSSQDTGFYEWQVPDRISSDVKVRIFDGDNALASAVSGSFQITGALALVSPAGGEVWDAGSKHSIEWTTRGSVPKVRLEAFEEPANAGPGAPQLLIIADTLNNKGSFEWTVPDQISDRLKIRVSDARDSAVNSVSKNPFSIIAHFEIKSPEQDDVWIVGSSHEIVWSAAGTAPLVLLEYSRDDFYRDINLIASNVPDTGAALWTLPDSIDPAVKVRVSDMRDSRAAGLSGPFKIRGAFSFIEPQSGPVWKVGSAQKVQWQTVGSIPSIRVEYSRDDFQKDIHVLENVRENRGGMDWTVPDIISNTVKLRITDERDTAVSAVSAPFKVEGLLKLKSPAGGEKFQVLSTQKVAWDTTGNISRVRLEYSKDDFNQDIHILVTDLKNQGSYDWVIPDETGDTITIRVLDAEDFSVSSGSPPFAIRGALLLTTATAGQRWPVGSKQEITWDTIGSIPFVRAEYSKDDFQKDVHVIAENIVNRGNVAWTVADDISSTVRLRIFDAAHGEIFSVSPEPASIAGRLEWAPDAAGLNAVVGEPVTLRWNSQGTIPVVRLEIASSAPAGPPRNDAAVKAAVIAKQSPDWKLITGSLENKGEFSWVVPDFITDQAILRISDARDANTSSISPVFTITGKLTLALPAGGERWLVGTSHDLVWSTAGTIPNVRLEYSTDGFKKDIKAITPASIANAGRFAWTVPDSISDFMQVRVQDPKAPRVRSDSNIFSIAGELSFIRPAGPAAWQIGVPQKIEWQTVGTIPFVRLEYAAADGKEGEEHGAILAARIENTGHFSWNIPEDAPAKIKLRVVHAEDTTVFAETQDPVRIFGVLSFTAPEGKQSWTVGSKQGIVWKTQGFVPNVKLEFSRDEFKRDIQTIFPLIPNTGSAQWEVPDAIAPEVWLRLSDADHPAVFAVTQQPVAIRGAFQMISPADGQPVKVGEKQEIVWQTVGSIPFVNLEYSADAFTASRAPIAEKISNTGHSFWEIPDAARQKLSVRVSDASDPAVFSISRAFGVRGKLELLSPRGGEIWKVGESAEIHWNSLGSMDSVKLEYSTDEFVTANAIAARAPNRGSFVWHIPAAIRQPVKVRISDADDPAVFAVTAAPLKIQGVLTMLAPQAGFPQDRHARGVLTTPSSQAGEFWTAGSQQPVLWQTQGIIPYVTLEYSVDNFNTAVPVMMGFSNEGRFQWTVPDLAAETLKFRISDAGDQSVFAMSGPVRVGGHLELLSPSGGEIFRVGDDAEIRWKTTGTIPKVRLEISGTGFKGGGIRLIQDAVENKDRFTWKVPDAIAKDLQVRVSDVRHPDIQDVSPGPFKIAGTLKITAPKAGEAWAVSSRKNLEWETRGTLPFVRVEYSKDNFLSAVPVDLHLRNTGKLEWAVPDFSGSEIQFRISDANDPSVSDTTPFRITVHGVLSLTSPTGDEVWKAKTEHPVTWNTVGTIPNVSLETIFPAAERPVKIAEAIANTGSFVWNTPDRTLRAVKVRVYDSRNPFIYSESPVFEIQGTVSLNMPQGGEIWIVGTEHPITWNSTGAIEKVRLEYSIDHFNTVLPIALALANEGRFQWRVPDAISRNVQVRLSDASQPAVISETEPFEIRGALTLINPIGGEDWAVGSRHPISWETTGTLPQVRLEYSADDFQKDIQLIAPSLPNKGLYYWDIPSLQANQIKVRVMDPVNPDVFDRSRNPVRIAGGLELLAPSNGEIYRVGEKIQVRWRSTPNIVNVKLEYSTDDFKTTVLISHYVPNTGSFDWNIPDRISENVRVRISDAANQIVAASSQIPFRIQGAFRFTSPKGDEVWNVGSRQKMAWDTLGSIGKVRLEYSGDGFKSSTPIAAGLDNQGSFEWTVPELAQDIQIRISDAAALSVQAVTEGKIHAAGRLELVSPAGGERWIVGEERILRWKILGIMPKVDLEYSKDNFNQDIHLIAAGIPNLGSYSWTIPNDPAKEVRVRLKHSSDAKIFDISKMPFRIDFNQVTWTVRDVHSGEHLTGLTLTDSTGKTQSGLSSPLVLEYPYGIYTTVWSKPGYGEFRSTWLADKDLNFTVMLNPEEKALETVRFDFRYDRERDLMSVKSWYEKDGAPLAAVVQSEVKIYQGTELLKTLISTTPDTDGYFHMVWDTHQVPGNARYTASASVTAANGQVYGGPVSYQLDIPVKEFKEPAARQSVSSIYLKPLGAGAGSIASQTSLLLAPSPTISSPNAELSSVGEQPPPPPAKASGGDNAKEQSIEQAVQPPSPAFVPSAVEPELSVSDSAVLNETISVTYRGSWESKPVLDLYDSNRKLVLRAEPMKAEGEGRFVYLLPVKGASFVSGKPVTVSVVDLATRHFKSAQIMIQTSSEALGLDRQAGLFSVQEILGQLNELISDIRIAEKDRSQWDSILPQIENRLSGLAGVLTQQKLPEPVVEKLNQAASLLAGLLAHKGYDAAFLTQSPLAAQPSAEDVQETLGHLRDAVQMMRKLYYYSSSH